LEKLKLHESTLSKLEDKKKKDLEYLKRQNEQIADLQKKLDARDEAHDDAVSELKRLLEQSEARAHVAEERESHQLMICSKQEEQIVQLESDLELARKELKALQQQLPQSPSGSQSLSPSSESDDSYVVVAAGSKGVPTVPASRTEKMKLPEASIEIGKLSLEVRT